MCVCVRVCVHLSHLSKSMVSLSHVQDAWVMRTPYLPSACHSDCTQHICSLPFNSTLITGLATLTQGFRLFDDHQPTARATGQEAATKGKPTRRIACVHHSRPTSVHSD